MRNISERTDNTSGRSFGTTKPLPGGGIKRPLAQVVHDRIMHLLDSGELTPGDRIISSELAQQLGLSRAPVREALHALAGQGLVELLPDRGAMLRPMSRTDLAQVYEITAPVAAIGLKGAAQRIGEGDNATRMAAAMERISRAGSGHPNVEFYLMMNQFHYLANSIAEKPFIDTVMRALNIEYWNRLLTEAIDLDRYAPDYVANYQRITDAILAGDSRSAEAIMLFHADWCASLLLGCE